MKALPAWQLLSTHYPAHEAGVVAGIIGGKSQAELRLPRLHQLLRHPRIKSIESCWASDSIYQGPHVVGRRWSLVYLSSSNPDQALGGPVR